MLTDAQYKAFKAWPDDNLYASFHPEELRMAYICGRKTLEELARTGLLNEKLSAKPLFTRVEPACSDAIREYEEAQEMRRKP